MVIRFIQFYGYLMLVCYEMWPNKARLMWSYFFFFMSGSFYFMLGEDKYYATLQDLNLTVANLGCYTGFLVLLIGVVMLIMFNWKCQFRLLRVAKSCVLLKWGFWLLELIYFPLLINIVEFSAIPYYTSKSAIYVIKISRDKST